MPTINIQSQKTRRMANGKTSGHASCKAFSKTCSYTRRHGHYKRRHTHRRHRRDKRRTKGGNNPITWNANLNTINWGGKTIEQRPIPVLLGKPVGTNDNDDIYLPIPVAGFVLDEWPHLCK